MKKYIKYIILFLFFLISLIFIFTLSRGDTFVNYGFSYAIRLGEIPYRDFNMVITPFAPLLYSIGLFIFNDIITFYIEQALLLTIMFYFLKKLLHHKVILYLLIMIIPFPIAMVSTIYPGYNFLLFFLFILFVYCFKNNKSDYLLGFILGLIFCTKQTVGIVCFLPTFYYFFSNRRIFFKILVGYCVPCLFLLFYLLISNSLHSFINLCFLGLFDFGHSNFQFNIFYFVLFIFGIIYLIFRINLDKKNILLYYSLCFGVVVFPIIDYYHVSLFLLVIFYLIVDSLNYNNKYNKMFIGLIASICLLWIVVLFNYFPNIDILNTRHFHLVINDKKYNNNVKRLNKYVNSSNKNFIFFMRGSENYYYKIMNNKKIDYFDLPNYGNYGYNGVDKMKDSIKCVHNSYFVIDNTLINNTDSSQQYIKELGNYIISKGSYVTSIGVYDIYLKK